MRAGQACPEWTEHNVSDPGITLIELFAWMTEMLGYRLNRIPDKLHLALLELLGIQVAEPVAATTEVRFRLAAPAVDPVEIPAGTTEVGTIRTASEESIVFQTSYDFTIPPARPMAYLVERAGAPKNVGVASGVARPEGLRPAGLRAAAQGRQRALPRLRHLARAPAPAHRRRLLAGARRGRGSRGPAAALRGLRRAVGEQLERGDGALRPHGRLQLRLRGDRAGAAQAALPEHDRRAARVLGALPARRHHALRRGQRRVHPRARDLRHHRRADRRGHPGRALVAAPVGAHRRERRLARPALSAALRARARADAGRAPRGAREPGRRRVAGLGAARVVRRERPERSALRARRRRRHDRARARGARAGRQLAAVRPRPARAGAAAHDRLPRRRRAARQCRGEAR